MRSPLRIARPIYGVLTACCVFSFAQAAAGESLTFRASPLPPAAPLLQTANAIRVAAPRIEPDPELFAAIDASPIVTRAPVIATPGDDRDFAFDLMDEHQRALALALDDWTRAAPRGERRRCAPICPRSTPPTNSRRFGKMAASGALLRARRRSGCMRAARTASICAPIRYPPSRPESQGSMKNSRCRKPSRPMSRRPRARGSTHSAFRA